ncbi:alkaline serine protease [Anaerobacillus alkaliphilus]|uniref:Alkaline serine protease n=1 Tax=Anaerobacillus alkaliphilus TaxID=1548597 RepID=A0A4Q0VVK2_9BACI|nr:S8 family serine peptidase [Anaerobacillus alkaliphilus]RXJ02937.1 alkaline serine protease [Anaerobacillus alkaliphilus]
MKWIKVTLLFLLLIGSFLSPINSLADERYQRVLIMFEGTIDEELIKSKNGHVLEELPSINSVVAMVPLERLPSLMVHSKIKYLEEDKVISVSSHWVDWGTEKIEASNAWSQNLTGKGVRVAVMDTGIAPHTDLDIKKGVSFVSYTDSYADDNGHGTHVAGVISAGKNLQGLKGIAPETELYAIKVLDHEGNGYHSDVIKGIEWAIAEEIDIINLSVGGSEGSAFLEAALKKAYEQHNILLVAAAGNNGHPLTRGNTVEYPAKYTTVIAVSATDRFDQRPSFSGHGTEVELAAPGVRIQSTYLNGGYQTLNGTSMAAPHVTGMLALLKQAQPSKTNEELRNLIRTYTVDLGSPGRDSLFGYGRIKFPNQIKIELPPPTPPMNVSYVKTFENGELILTLMWQHSEATTFKIYRNDKKVGEISDQQSFTEKITRGAYTYEVSAVNEDGLESKRASIYIESEYQKTAKLYSDVNVGDWYISALHQLQEERIVGGYPDGTFKPNRAVTRAELAAFIGRALKLDGTKRRTVFPDVHEPLFASGFIQTAQELGLITGYPDGTFRPNNPVTREEVAVFLTRAFNLSKTTNQTFPDVDPKHYTFSAIQRTVGEGIATGYPDGTYRPKQPVTRAELTTFLARSLSK